MYADAARHSRHRTRSIERQGVHDRTRGCVDCKRVLFESFDRDSFHYGRNGPRSAHTPSGHDRPWATEPRRRGASRRRRYGRCATPWVSEAAFLRREARCVRPRLGALDVHRVQSCTAGFDPRRHGPAVSRRHGFCWGRSGFRAPRLRTARAGGARESRGARSPHERAFGAPGRAVGDDRGRVIRHRVSPEGHALDGRRRSRHGGRRRRRFRTPSTQACSAFTRAPRGASNPVCRSLRNDRADPTDVGERHPRRL